METTYYELTQPDQIPTREKEDAMGSYLMMFAALGAGLPLPIINLIASIVYYYMNKSNSNFVRFHTYQALISSIPLTLMNASGLFWGIRILFFDGWSATNTFKGYIGMLIMANLLYFVVGIIAAIKARKGLMFYYWFFGKIAYMHVFKVTINVANTELMNLPPKL